MKFLQIFLFAITPIIHLQAQNISVLIIAGGHSFDTLAFFNMFDRLEGIDYDFMLQPAANRSIADQMTESYDVLLFYDMWNEIGEQEKQAYIGLTEAGKPMLFLHHSLASYQNWDDFGQVTGGKYIEKAGSGQSEASTYKHDVWVEIQIAGSGHPVTSGIPDFTLFDEVYGNFRVNEKVIPLLKTNHPESTPVIGWENQFNKSRIIYLQPGHDHHAYENEHFRNLVHRSLKYLAGKL
jgi:uncharacterized protein